MLIGLFILALAAVTPLLAAPERSWSFDGDLQGWQQPAGDCGVVPDPENPANRLYRIHTDKPHHTQLVLKESQATPDFLASVRIRVVSYEGDPPAVYVYGRLQGQFRALCLQDREARAFCYFGQDRPSVSLGKAALPTPFSAAKWLRAKLLCFGDHLFAKVWGEGAREPAWQIAGQCSDQARGAFALGVWTSPRTPSKATVLFDDVTFQPLAEADLAALHVRVTPRQPLDLVRLPDGTGIFELRDEIGLATTQMAVSFDRQTGEIAHLVDRPSGQEFVAADTLRPLFRLVLTKPAAGETTPVTAAEFARVTPERTGGRSLTWRFSALGSLPLGVRVSASADTTGMVRLRLQLTNESDWAVSQIDFPQMAHPGALGADAEDDRLILPWADGSVLEAPGSRTQSRSAVYPGAAFTQFTALYDRTAGLYQAAYDAGGNCKRWNLQTSAGRSAEMSLSHLLPEVPQPEVSLPYDVVLGTFHGDWRDAADLYKAWATQQPWCAKKLTERDDVPQFLKEGAGIVIGSINNPQGRERSVGANLERLPELTTAYRKQTGLAHVVFVPYGWENRGTWAGINYLPAVPSNEAWEQANAALRAQGDRTAFLTSGYWWVTKRQQTGNGPAFDDSAQFERLRDRVIHDADGKPWLVDDYNRAGAFGDWRGLSASLCHGSKVARETMLRVFLDVAKLGVPLISFDQEIGGGQSAPCYSATHGHPPGYGSWMWTDFRDLCADILKEGKPLQPELGLFMENVSELAIPYMATYWSRQFGEVDHGAVGARGGGLFSYLYHEYVTAIGAACVQGQGQLGTRPSPELRRCVLANNLTRGLVPGPFLNDVPLQPSNKWQEEIAPAFFSYCQPYARFPEYLVLGTTRRPPDVQCASVEAWFYRQDANGEPLKPGGPKVVKAAIALPAVAAGSFEGADESVGTVLVNTTRVDQDATVRLLRTPKSAILYRADRTQEGAEAPTQEIRLHLEPLGTRVLVTR
ncbi:MAG: hypothetical protein AUJ96_32375 [Armatimonadetes bacterium CG2_30_66_41]|nr:hypothetical protein [Armatimonadota bacterium]OIO92356.1 MAG: hypothetical protein AUJ96_32375 [Armatimonadetes bacterium CG2_30_66_41]PIX38539.1 MAG: hypothetical protein COZ57_30305 [Armatimonadetes bacterium CG_4_8_14_3_um_filter_66_20]PJB63925.1 MAG: hypothetical protein CO096_20655 [Armatimonadetes bacterium CG_4_9_14_3_um_filter_66_14]NCO90888.1 hypothetical protein [Armatimonadota bacterium]